MRLAVSNIAWRPEEAEAALDLLADRGVAGLEIAPGLVFPQEPDPFLPSDTAVDAWRHGLSRRGLQLVSMQSLLFGRADAALFGAEDQRQAFEAGLRGAIDLAAQLDCPNLVLGSPTARRIPDDMDAAEAHGIAVDVIGCLGDLCHARGAILALEPNPAAYGTNFLNTFAETAAFVRALDHPAVRVNLDIGALTMNEETERAVATFGATHPLIGHVHISEPHLAPAPADTAALIRVLGPLCTLRPSGWASIEMRGGDGDNLTTLKACIAAAQSVIAAMGFAPG
jgi:sugar phosphate isomerase/epimerase